MILAIRIWLKLKNSIPLRYRKYYSLLPDPAAGKVTVVARAPSLELPGLWSITAGRNASKKVSLSRPHTALPTLVDHVAFIPVALASPSFTASRMLTRRFHLSRQRLLGRTWMTLADRCRLALGSAPEEEDEVRFSVESDMNANAPTPLKMIWAQFVWLSLALGVCPHDPAWRNNYPCTLKDSQGSALITLFESDGQLLARVFTERNISYSLSRALAWHNIILESKGLWPLGGQQKSHVPLDSVQISPGLSKLLNTDDLVHGADGLLRGKEFQDCEDPLASACRWMLYNRQQLETNGDWIPASQQMLEFRERTLCQLYLLDRRGQLEEKIRLLIKTPPETQNLVAVGYEHMANDGALRATEAQNTEMHDEYMQSSVTSVPDQTGTIASVPDAPREVEQHIPIGCEQPDLDLHSLDGQMADQRELTSLASATQETEVGASSPETAHADSTQGHDPHSKPPAVIAQAQPTDSTAGSFPETTLELAMQLITSQSKIASRIMDAIRSAFAASNYVKRFELFMSIQIDILSAFVNLIKSADQRRLRVIFCDREGNETEGALKQALGRLSKFRGECNELATLRNCNVRDSKMTDAYALLPSKHRMMLEDAVLTTPSPSSILRSDGPSDILFIAKVALATAEWDSVIHQTWRLNTETTNFYETLISEWNDKEAHPRIDRKKRLDIQRKAEFDTDFMFTALANDGLYNAPESSELDTLLTKEFRNVCLL